MSAAASARGPQAVSRFLRPRSVAIVGTRRGPRSAGQVILQSLKVNRFGGDIQLVGRTDEPIDGRQVLKSAEALPEGVDLAVLTLPAAAVPDALAACQRRKVGSALIFAAGFAETGDRELQERIAISARDAGLAIVGPNCLGYTNNVDGMMMHMLFAQEARTFKAGDRQGVAFIGQSGGMLGHLQRAAGAREIPISYVVSTGNEAGLDVVDFVEFLVEDQADSRARALCGSRSSARRHSSKYVRAARAAGKPVVMLHPGRSAKAQQRHAVQTGSLVGDYGTMRVQAEHAGVLMVDSMDEMNGPRQPARPFSAASDEGAGNHDSVGRVRRACQ